MHKISALNLGDEKCTACGKQPLLDLQDRDRSGYSARLGLIDRQAWTVDQGLGSDVAIFRIYVPS